jgi:hypothetical protein
MPANDPHRRHAIARAAAARRHRLPSADDLRAQVIGDTLEAHIRTVIDGAPPLTSEQRARLADLLRPADTTRVAS